MGYGRGVGIIPLIVGVALSVPVAPARALETDQFTVPDRPLVDIGPEVSPYVMATLWDVVHEANGRSAAHEREARRTPWVMWKHHHRAKARQFRGEDYLARRLYEALAGGGLPECKIELWVRARPFRARREGRVLFPMDCGRAVYGDSLLTKSIFLNDLSPTVNVHGCYMGTDKLGHFFQQGYEYFREYRHAELRGAGGRRALAHAVRLGVAQESGIFGEGLIGVYSNADLAANYAGLKFYLNLTRPVSVAGVALPPLLVRGGDGLWVLNPEGAGRGAGAGAVLRPFISDHFNEALNPSRFSDQMRRTVRSNLRRRAERLVAFYRTTVEEARETLVELSTWHGEDYGHCRFSRVVTMADTCFPADTRLARKAAPKVAPVPPKVAPQEPVVQEGGVRPVAAGIAARRSDSPDRLR